MLEKKYSQNIFHYLPIIPIVILHYQFQCYKHNLQTEITLELSYTQMSIIYYWEGRWSLAES